MDKSGKIFVTGGTGFIGSYILHELVSRGFRNIHAIRRLNTDISPFDSLGDRIKWHISDILDTENIYRLIEGSVRVIHASGLVSYAPADKDNLYEVNVLGTENVVNACLEHQIPRLIHLSSIAALAKINDGKLISEDTTWLDDKHTSHYGRSKHLAEMEVWRGMAEGLNANILNPSVVLGSGGWNNSSCRLFKKIYDGLKYYTPGSTGFVDVRDVAGIAIDMMYNNVVNKRFIINENNYSFKQIFSWMAEGMEVPSPSKEAPKWLAKTVVQIESLKSKVTKNTPVITNDSIRNAYENFHYDNQLVKSLGYTFIPIQQTIRETTALFNMSAEKDFTSMFFLPRSNNLSKDAI